MSSHRIRRPWVSLALAGLSALVAVALVGCVNIPTGGSVSTGQIDAGDVDNQPILLPSGPVKDMTPEEIIDGFLRAGSGPLEFYSVARKFLTDDFKDKWDSSAGVLISSTSIAPIALAANTYSVSISVSGRVDADGIYTTTSGTQDLTFGLVQDDKKQWRISSAPPGTVLSPRSFQQVFNSYRVYFFDPSFQYLVPDLRWFLDTKGVDSRIVHALIGGPSSWMGSGTLISAFPAGTQMKGSPQIASGKATVDFTSEVSAAPPIDQRRMLQQLNQSLREALSTVSDVEITVGGFPISVQLGENAPDSSFLVGVDPVGGLDGKFGLLGDKSVQPLKAIDAAADAFSPDAATLGSDRKAVAVRGPAGVTLVRSGADPVLIDSRAGLVAPSMDPEGYTWTVPAGDASALRATAPNGKSYPIGSLSSDDTVVSFDVSRDGARVLVALATPTGPRLLVAGVQRNADLAPVALGEPVALPIGSAPLVDATWVDGVQVAVLSGTGANDVDLYEIGGQHVELGAVAGGTMIVGGNGTDGIRVLNADGLVLRPTGAAGWQQDGDLHASFLATQL